MLTRFAAEENWHLEDLGAQLPLHNGRRVFWLELHRDSIEVDVNNIGRENLVLVWFYELKEKADFDGPVSRLEEALRQGWPNIHPYTGL
jgi:hypothetical protein